MTDSPSAWDPIQYNRFDAERERAADDLLARLPLDFDPGTIWDLGCGTGTQAAQLKTLYPRARVHGLDNSPAMLAMASARAVDVDFQMGDIGTWSPDRPVDLILANASLHWLPAHVALMTRLTEALTSGGVLAVQMPMAYETRHHEILRSVASQPAWSAQLAGVQTIAPLLNPEAYYAVLAQSCVSVDIWATTYLHALAGPDAVLEWMKGTALRPYLAALGNDASRSAFLSALACALSPAFPPQSDGKTLLRFPRLFLVARRGEQTGVAAGR